MLIRLGCILVTMIFNGVTAHVYTCIMLILPPRWRCMLSVGFQNEGNFGFLVLLPKHCTWSLWHVLVLFSYLVVSDIIHLGGPCSRLEHVLFHRGLELIFWLHRDVFLNIFSLGN